MTTKEAMTFYVVKRDDTGHYLSSITKDWYEKMRAGCIVNKAHALHLFLETDEPEARIVKVEVREVEGE
jgi:hypothetical protein